MFKQKRLTVLSIAVLLALLVAAVLPFAALADDNVPPVDAPAVEEVVPLVENVVPVANEAAPVVDEVVPTVEEPVTVSEVLDAVPADTELVVLDENGNPLPMASQEAADAILSDTDPMWCPGSTLLGGVGCTKPFDLFTTNKGLIKTLEGSTFSGPGTIYISTGDINSGDQGKNIVLNGSNMPTSLSSSDLTIQGGWDFDKSSPTYNTLVSRSVFLNSTFEIKNWSGNIFVNDVKLDYAGEISGDGLTIKNITGDVTLNNVVVTDANGNGLLINKVNNIEINDSKFNNNYNNGAELSTTGEIVMNNVVAKYNGGQGVDASAKGDITVNDGHFSQNWGDGLYLSGDNVTLNNVTANNNNNEDGGFNGAELSAKGTIVLNNVIAKENGNLGVDASAKGDITVSDGNFSKNWGGGLTLTGSNVTLNNVTASNNYYGWFCDGDYFCKEGGGNGATLSGSNMIVNGGEFNTNYDYGLFLMHTGNHPGNVDLNNVTADNNGLSGVYITSSSSRSTDVNVVCGKYANNDQFGLYFVLNSGDKTFLGGPKLGGNGSGKYTWDGGKRPSLGLCGDEGGDDGGGEGGGDNGDGERGFKAQNNLIPLIPVTGQVCSGEKKIVLKAGDAIAEYESLCDIEFQLNEVDPMGVLPTGSTKLASLETKVISGGTDLGQLPSGGKITLKFSIPAGTDAANLSVLFWNGSEWVKVTGGKVVDGFYVVEAGNPGNYVLTSQ